MTPTSADCLEFARHAESVLDRAAAVESLDTPHSASCRECRDHAAAVRDLLMGLNEAAPMPPTGFAGRVVAAAVRDRRVRARRRYAGFAVAAGIAVAVAVLAWPRADVVPNPQPFAQQQLPPEPAPVRVGDRFAEAGSAIASLTRQTADDTLTLIPVVETPMLNLIPTVPMDTDPTVASLADIPQTASVGLEPVADSARRAFNLFLRDTGLSGSAKPNS